MGMIRTANKSGIWQGVIQPTEAIIHQAINDEYSCEIVVPIHPDTGYDLIDRDTIIELPDANDTKQLFRLETPEQTLTTVSAFGWHISQDLARDQIINSGWENRTGAYVLPLLVQSGISETRFTGTSNISTVNSLKIVRRSVLSALIGDQDNSFVNRFGGELERDNFTVNMLSRLGADKGYRIAYRKNLLGFTAKADDSKIINRIVPTYLNASDAAVLLPETYIDSPRISDTAVPHSQAMHFGDIRVGEEEEAGIITCPDAASAQQAVRDRIAELYASGIDQPQVTVSVDFVELRKTREYREYQDLETLLIGDSVTLLYDQWTIRERMIAYTWDCLREEYTSITLGRLEPSMDALTARISTEIKDRTDETIRERYMPSLVNSLAGLASAVSQASGWFSTTIEDADGAKRIYLHDKPDIVDSLKIEYFPEPGVRAYTNSGWNGGNPVWIAGETDGSMVMDTIQARKIGAQYIVVENGITTVQQALTEIEGDQISLRRFANGTNLIRNTSQEFRAYPFFGTGYPASISVGGSADYLAPGDIFTVSAWLQAEGMATGMAMRVTTNAGTETVYSNDGYEPGSEGRAYIAKLLPPGTTTVEVGFTFADPIYSGQVHYRELMGSLGNRVMPWVPYLADVATHMQETNASLTVLDGALQTKVEQSDFDQGRLDLIDMLTGKASLDDIQTISQLQATMLQTQDQWAVVISDIQDITGDQEVTLNQVKNYMTFGVEGLTLGDTDSSMKLRLQNDRISFLDAGTEVAWITGQKLYITQVEITESLIVGNHKFEKYDTEVTIMNWMGG